MIKRAQKSWEKEQSEEWWKKDTKNIDKKSNKKEGKSDEKNVSEKEGWCKLYLKMVKLQPCVTRPEENDKSGPNFDEKCKENTEKESEKVGKSRPLTK